VKQIIFITIAIVAVIGGAVLLSGGDEEVVGATSNNFFGPEDASVVITEYADFECPACANFAPVVDTVKEEFADQVKFEFKHFPLVQIHPNAIAAHRAAQAAANQGAFWEMHDLLYEQQATWRAQGSGGGGGFNNTNAAATFEGFAGQLGLDIEQYKEDVASDETIAVINADIAEGREKGAQSTPTFYVNGELIEDLNTVATPEGFRAFLEAELANVSAESDEDAEQTNASEPADEDVKPEDSADTEE